MKDRNYSVIFRIMHWAIAICMIMLLFTIFLRLTWMNKEHVADIIQRFLSSTDQSLSRDQLIVLAKQIRKPMWDWHIYFGYALAGLYCIRMALLLLGEMKISNPLNKQLTSRERIHYWVYLVFYVCVAISLITGLLIVLGPKNLKSSMEAIHVVSIYYLLAFIFIHIGGVLFAEFSDQQGIISKIVSGRKGAEKNQGTKA